MKQRKEYSRYYGDFRGVDFSSDHTLVNDSRFPYLVNMYKDYASGGGQGIETIPGFRRRFTAPNGGRIYGIHSYKLPTGEGGALERHVLVHAGNKLYKWVGFPNDISDARMESLVVREYDEYSSKIEGVKVDEDYVYVTERLGDFLRDTDFTVTVRAVKGSNADWVSACSERDPESDPNGAMYIADAYSYKVIDQDGKLQLRVVIKKTIRDQTGKVVARFYPGDMVLYRVIVTGPSFRLPADLAATAQEYDEFTELGYMDYAAIDVSDYASYIISGIYTLSGTQIDPESWQRYGNIILIPKSLVRVGDQLRVALSAAEPLELEGEMNARGSSSFVFGDKIYVLDGKKYIAYDGSGVSYAAENAYVPTTYINIVVGGENADAGKEYEARNILQPKFKHTFIADSETTEYHMNENELDGIAEVKVYGEILTEGSDYEVDLVNGKITFAVAPVKPEEAQTSEGVPYPEAYAGVEIVASKGMYPAIEGDGDTSCDDFKSMINSATIATVFDNRVFFSGIHERPNLIFWSSLKNPTYIGILNYVQDGLGTTPITAMLPVANTLLVLKGDTEQEGAVYYHTPHETGVDVMPKTYPSEGGLAGIGCLGAACNFLDDPVYISRLGLEAIGQLSVRLERAKEHRSSLIDANIVNKAALSDAALCEWDGYLVMLVDGRMHLADSRQVYQNNRGEIEYEWYYVEDVGVFEGQHTRERYTTEYPLMFTTEEGERMPLTVEHEGVEYEVRLASDEFPDDPPAEVSEGLPVVYAETKVGDKKYTYSAAIYPSAKGKVALLCDTDGEMIGGEFKAAVTVREIDDNIFFGTENGVVCSFNFDKRDIEGDISSEYYTFDGRAILSGCALKMDNCGIPHLNKTTVKKSTVIKTKSGQSSAAKVRVRTNRNPYSEIARINASKFSFDKMDFSDFSFVTGDDSLFSIKEKEKKWVEKQYYIYSDEYKKPFALLYVAFQYYVAGKFKK